MMARNKLLLISDNCLVREGLLAISKNAPTISIAFVSGKVDNVLLHTQSLQPHLILFDADLPKETILYIIGLLKKKFSYIKIVVMNLHPTQTYILEYVKIGVAGFLVKDSTQEDVLRTIDSVVHGLKVLPSALTASLFAEIEKYAVLNGTIHSNNCFGLTKREQEIISLIQEGLSNKEIAQRLNIATYTAKSHVHNIMEKLGTHSRIQVSSRMQTPTANNELNNQLAIKSDHFLTRKD